MYENGYFSAIEFRGKSMLVPLVYDNLFPPVLGCVGSILYPFSRLNSDKVSGPTLQHEGTFGALMDFLDISQWNISAGTCFC